MEAAPIRRGVWMFPGADAARLADAIVAAEDLGLDEVWVADGGVARDPMIVLAAAAGRTKRIRLGVGVTSPVIRHPGVLAATLATIDELAPGRAVLGLGVGGEMTLGPFGLGVAHPVAELRDSITTARHVLAGAPGGGYSPPGHALPPRAVPIWVGARGPRLVELAARHADGLLVSGCTSAERERIVGAVRGVGSPCEIALYQSAAADIDETTVGWDEIVTVLDGLVARHRPEAIGISLVELLEGADPVDLVIAAAACLTAVNTT